MTDRPDIHETHAFTLEELSVLLPALRHQLEHEALQGELVRLETRLLSDLKRKTPVCPACGYRPARHRKTGWCEVCWTRRLTEEAELATLEALERRHLNAARRRRDRARASERATRVR